MRAPDVRWGQLLRTAGLVMALLSRPRSWPWLGRWLPEGAAWALTSPGDGYLPMWVGGLVFAAYGLVLALAGGRLLAGRDLA